MPHRPRVFAVIDVLDRVQAVRSADLAFALGADGMLFDNSDDDDGVLMMVATHLRTSWPEKLLGAGYSRLCPAEALERSLRHKLDVTWNMRTDVMSHAATAAAVHAASILEKHDKHSFFASIDARSDATESRPDVAALRARQLGMIPTTASEPPPGPYRKLQSIRGALGEAPFALAATGPTSLPALATLPSHVFVSTATEGGFQYLNPDVLRTCMARLASATLALPRR